MSEQTINIATRARNTRVLDKWPCAPWQHQINREAVNICRELLEGNCFEIALSSVKCAKALGTVHGDNEGRPIAATCCAGRCAEFANTEQPIEVNIVIFGVAHVRVEESYPFETANGWLRVTTKLS